MSNYLFYGGIALTAFAALGGLAAVFLLKKAKRKLDIQLESEYGKHPK